MIGKRVVRGRDNGPVPVGTSVAANVVVGTLSRHGRSPN